MMMVYRFAPSPTGYLHVGGARTAIFNFLLARQANGRFLLRIEDTDRKRSTTGFVAQIQNSLEWLRISWDEPPLFQSTRIKRHLEIVRQLLVSGKAYACFCSQEELDRKRQRAIAQKAPLRYDGTCRNLSDAERQQQAAAGIAAVIRLKTAGHDVVFDDVIRGSMRTSGDEIDDFVILRSDGTPVYQIAVVVDDHDMGVSHVIRGEDHLSNTPKQILIYQSLNWPVPVFGHLPLILGSDRNRLSKRHGATSVEEFREQGILAEALFNYLCLLGWSPGNDLEILSLQELIENFDINRINKAGAVFDYQKLLWMNSKYLSAMKPEQLLKILEQQIPDNYRAKLLSDNENALRLMGMLRERCRVASDLVEGAQFYFEHPANYEEEGVTKHFGEVARNYLEKIRSEISQIEYFNAAALETKIRAIADKEGIGAGKLIHPLRLALTGKTSSPGIFDVLEVLGRKTVLERIDRALDYIDRLK